MSHRSPTSRNSADAAQSTTSSKAAQTTATPMASVLESLTVAELMP